MTSTSFSTHRLRVVVGQRVLEGLTAGGVGAEAGLEQLAGRLAGPEPGDADLTGDALERGVDLLLELGLVDLDGELHLVALEGLDRGLHEATDCTGARAADPHRSRRADRFASAATTPPSGAGSPANPGIGPWRRAAGLPPGRSPSAGRRAGRASSRSHGDPWYGPGHVRPCRAVLRGRCPPRTRRGAEAGPAGVGGAGPAGGGPAGVGVGWGGCSAWSRWPSRSPPSRSVDR